MKLNNNLILLITIALIVVATLYLNPGPVQLDNVASAGKFTGNPESTHPKNETLKGNAYVLGSDDAMNLVLESVAAYNAKDSDKELSYYSDDFKTEARVNGTRQWHESMETLSMNPWAMIPVRLQEDDRTLVLSWSVEDRVWKNGSKETIDLMEVFAVNDSDGKISGFSQWHSHRWDGSTDHGLPVGGKYFGRTESEYSGRPLVFSNRGEVQILEQFFADYNNMDGEAVAGYFADEWTFRAATGGTSQRTSEDMKSIFDSLESVKWTPFSMTPLKIYDTDPESGVTVYSTEKRVMKDGTVWEKDLVELFFFDLEGKISGVEQYAREISAE